MNAEQASKRDVAEADPPEFGGRPMPLGHMFFNTPVNGPYCGTPARVPETHPLDAVPGSSQMGNVGLVLSGDRRRNSLAPDSKRSTLTFVLWEACAGSEEADSPKVFCKHRHISLGSALMYRLIVGLPFAALAALSTSHLMASVIPPIGLAPGSPYQLVFVTYAAIPGTSPSEAPYNTFVNSEAGASPTLPVSIWHAVTSTADGTNADVNAPSPAGGLPVYNTAGQLVATAATGLYTAPLVNPIEFDQFGNLATQAPDPWSANAWTWTGSQLPGVAVPGAELGSFVGGTEVGINVATIPTWITALTFASTNALQVYALSGTLISPIPEPTSITLFGSGVLLLCAMRLHHRRRYYSRST